MTLIANTELIICTVETQAKHPELFHYTNAAAFESIVKSNAFWASHSADMADQTEVLLMRDQLPAAVATRFEEIVAPLNRHDRRLFKAAGGGISKFADYRRRTGKALPRILLVIDEFQVLFRRR